MKQNISFFAKIVNPTLVNRLIKTFDKATMVIVSATWGGAILLVLFALYTVNLSVEAKEKVIEAAATEPGLPRIVTQSPKSKEMETLYERLRKRFPGIKFTLANDQSMQISANDGEQFRTWLTVLSYVDTISPQYRWQIRSFCVGATCSGGTPMQAVLEASKISFAVPGPES